MAASPVNQLKQFALQIANDTLGRAQSLKPERVKIQLRLKEIEGIMKAADVCHQRVRDFSAHVGRDLQCPRCWILNEAKTALTPIPSDTKDDLFRCDVCGQSVRIEMGF